MTSAESIRFKLTCSDQRSSGLVQLPAELLSKILFLLLKHDGILSTHVLTARDKWTQLSPQLLRTCQILYYEAQHILYRQNVAPIRICANPRTQKNVLSVQVLDACAWFFDPTCDHGFPHLLRSRARKDSIGILVIVPLLKLCKR